MRGRVDERTDDDARAHTHTDDAAPKMLSHSRPVVRICEMWVSNIPPKLGGQKSMSGENGPRSFTQCHACVVRVV